MISILFIGDVVGFSGLDFIKENLNYIKEKYHPHFIIINGENICNGKGITADLRLMEKIKAAKTLFPEDREILSCSNQFV